MFYFFHVNVKVTLTQALNMGPLKTVDYGALFKKLKKELIKFTQVLINKKPKKDQQTYYLTNNKL